MSEAVTDPCAGAVPPDRFEPRIVAFFCTWCTYTASDLAGVARMKYPANARVIRVMCSGRVDPQFVLRAFRQGADGVLVGGCHPGDCHYQEGNHKCSKRVQLLHDYLAQMGIDPGRLRLEWISASEGERLRDVIADMVAQLKRMGPLQMQAVPGSADYAGGSEADMSVDIQGAMP